MLNIWLANDTHKMHLQERFSADGVVNFSKVMIRQIGRQIGYFVNSRSILKNDWLLNEALLGLWDYGLLGGFTEKRYGLLATKFENYRLFVLHFKVTDYYQSLSLGIFFYKLGIRIISKMYPVKWSVLTPPPPLAKNKGGGALKWRKRVSLSREVNSGIRCQRQDQDGRYCMNHGLITPRSITPWYKD